MAETNLPRGVIPPGTYAKGGRSPIVYVLLCPVCAGYAPITDPDYSGFLSGRCQGCGADSRELHRFQALIMSAANGGCMCTTEHRQVAGDLPTETSALAVWTEVKTRPVMARGDVPEVKVIYRESWRAESWDADTPSRSGWQVRCPTCGLLGSPAGWAYEDSTKAQMIATRHRNRHVRGET